MLLCLLFEGGIVKAGFHEMSASMYSAAQNQVQDYDSAAFYLYSENLQFHVKIITP
jgi:hypothetical protein